MTRITNSAATGRLSQKVVLITGGSSGIGAAAARRFAAEGARVAVMARREDVLGQLAAQIGALAVAADVSNGPQVATAVRTVAEALGDPDIVVNSAGVCIPASLADTDDQNWRRHIDVNLSGSFYVAREAGVRMAAGRGGTIINVGSELSVMGMASYVAYCSAKAGVIGLTKSLAAELAPKVTVNAICPGPVDTPMLRAEFEYFGDGDQVAAEAVKRVPLRRFATADEVAAGIYYLAVDAPYASGTTLELDGGTTAV
jgi:NAD(P)-dependent dehydrogenase (short-subunit alcohol dehydrogenase family)